MTSSAAWLVLGVVSWTVVGVFLGRFIASSWDRAPERQP